MLAIGDGETTCECCGRKVTPATQVWLELDQRIDEYHDYELGVPVEKSQGWFIFGAACATKRLKAAREAAKAKGIYLGRRRAGKVKQAEMFIAAKRKTT